MLRVPVPVRSDLTVPVVRMRSIRSRYCCIDPPYRRPFAPQCRLAPGSGPARLRLGLGVPSGLASATDAVAGRPAGGQLVDPGDHDGADDRPDQTAGP